MSNTPSSNKSWLRAAWLVLTIVGIACLAVPASVAGQTSPMPSAGATHTCALTRSGGVRCWGFNGNGQLGDGTTVNRSTPGYVSDLTGGVVAMTAGWDHTCAVTSEGAVKCWGSNDAGQLGDGTRIARSRPVDVVGLSGAVAVVGGEGHTCALMTAGGVKCWGSNGGGQLGDGTRIDRPTPVDVVGLNGVVALAGGGNHTCALTAASGVKCWGWNPFGQLGDGTVIDRTLPVDVDGLTSGASRLAAAGGHTCAALIAGGVECWGYNHDGQLGDATTTNRPTPVPVIGLTSAVAIAAGGAHTCAVSADGLRCWGLNAFGQLGDGTQTDQLTPAGVVAGNVPSVTAGQLHTCASTPDGRVLCWGYNNYGQVGSPSPTSVLRPTAVPGFGVPTSDFNGDGWPDLVWHNRVTGDVLFYLMNGTTLSQQVPLANVPVPRAGTRDINWRIAAFGDFNGDEWPDIVWRHRVTGENKVWLLNQTTYVRETTLPRVADLAWKLVAAADFNGDLKTDLVWRNQSTGDVVVWYMNGAAYAGFAWVAGIKDPAWTIVTADDFNADGWPDLLWRNLTSGQLLVWYMNGVAYADWRLIEPWGDVESWEIVGTGDFNRDGSPDIIWHSVLYGDQVKDLVGNRFASLPPAPPAGEWALLHPSDTAKNSLQDFNADGSPDILWHHELYGVLRIWYLWGSSGARHLTEASIDTDEPDLDWKPVAVADFDRDGLPDIVWRNYGTQADAGKNRIWLINGTVKSGEMALPTIVNQNGSDWRIVGVGDFNQDGHPDLAWRNYGTDASGGANIIWFLKNGVYDGWTAPPTIADTNWRIVAVGDFNGDGWPDLFWRNQATGVNIAWFLVNGVYAGWGAPPTINDTSWQIVGAADYNGDGKADLLWRNYGPGPDAGRNLIWYLNNGAYVGWAELKPQGIEWTTGPGR